MILTTSPIEYCGAIENIGAVPHHYMSWCQGKFKFTTVSLYGVVPWNIDPAPHLYVSWCHGNIGPTLHLYMSWYHGKYRSSANMYMSWCRGKDSSSFTSFQTPHGGTYDQASTSCEGSLRVIKDKYNVRLAYRETTT